MGKKKVKLNRTELIRIRCTAEEKEAIKKLASEYGIDVSSFMRGKVFEKEISMINAVEFLAIYKESVHELKKIGNNINQLARYANYAKNAGQFPLELYSELNKYLEELTVSQRKVADAERKIMRS